MSHSNITLIKISIVGLLSLLLPIKIYASGATQMSGSTIVKTDNKFKPYPIDEWEINGHYGIGKIAGKNATIGLMKEKYANASISLEMYDDMQPYGQYVVKLNGDVLFTTACWCKFDIARGKWIGYSSSSPKTRPLGDKQIIQGVYTNNPRYHTRKGVSVGHTLAKLRKAYSEKDYIIYTYDSNVSAPTSYTTCVIPKKRLNTRGSKPDEAKGLIFHVAMPEGKTLAIDDKTLFDGAPRLNRFDPNAKVLAISAATGHDCEDPDL